jgi:hypothetical protein
MRQFISLRVALQIDQLHRVARGFQHIYHVSSGDTISLAESLQDIDALWSELKQRAFQWEYRECFAINGFDKASVNETLAYRTSHLLGHRKGGGRSRGHDARGILGIRHAVRLGELKRSEVVDGFLGCESVVIFRKPHTMRIQFQADHKGREKVHEILQKQKPKSSTNIVFKLLSILCIMLKLI